MSAPFPDRATLTTKAANTTPIETPLLRFSLRNLLYLVAAISLLLTIWISVNGQLKIVLMVSVLVVVAHVMATYLGGALKRNAQRARMWREQTGIADPDESASRVPCLPAHRSNLPPVGALGQQSMRLRWLPLLVAAGAIAGGVIGWIGLEATVGPRVTLAGMLFGAASTALLGAWIAFLAIGFVTITRHAWLEAQQFESESKTTDQVAN